MVARRPLVSPPSRGAWIEISGVGGHQAGAAGVAPLAGGRGLKSEKPKGKNSSKQSPPSRGRGLKFHLGLALQGRPWSPPSRGAWIEIRIGMVARRPLVSPPSRGAWIEISGVGGHQAGAAGVAPSPSLPAGCALMSGGEVQLRAVRGNVSGFVPVVHLPEKLLCRFYMAFFLRLHRRFQ